MATDYHERCLKCKWLAPDLNPPCGRTFNATIHISPHGGIVNISTTPGMIPDQFKDKIEHMLGRVFEQVTVVIEKWPGWAELGEIQAGNPDKTECPGRDAVENPYLRIVRNEKMV